MNALLLHLSRRSVTLVTLESLLIVGAIAAAAAARLGLEEGAGLMATPAGLGRAALIAAVCQLCLYFGDLYDARVVSDRRETFVRVLQALSATSIILALVYFFFPAAVIGRGVFIIAAVLVISLVIGWRVAFEWLTRRVGPRERLLLVGTTEGAVTLARELFERRVQLGVEIVGFVDPDPARVGEPLINPGIVGTIDDIPRIVRERGVDRVVVSLADARGKLPMEKLLDMRLAGVTFHHLASEYERYTGKIAIENLRPSWFIFSAGFNKTRAMAAVKRALDVAAAAFGLVAAAPVMLAVAALVKLTSAGPALYTQQRVGRDGRVFAIRKFRSMRQDAEARSGAVWAQANDARVTPVGRVLRKMRLDELPQLWNVLVGDMSLVGPRPERPEFVRALTEQIPFYGQRHAVKPGLTGWAQVRYSYGSSVEDAMQKLQYDLYYIKHMSLALDLFIIVSTVKTVVLRRGT
jgi:sugar transferase (PEP-CTERM system associated)